MIDISRTRVTFPVPERQSSGMKGTEVTHPVSTASKKAPRSMSAFRGHVRIGVVGITVRGDT